MTREEFAPLFAALCAAYDRPVTPEREAAYWQAFHGLHVAGWQRLVETCLGEDGPERMPTVRALWDVRAKLKRAAPAINRQDEAAPWHGSESRRLLNCMLIRWLWAEREAGRVGCLVPAELEARVLACQELATAHEMLIADRDPSATPARLRESFDAAMAHVPRLPATHPSAARAYRVPLALAPA